MATLFDSVETVQEAPGDVLKDILGTCTRCRLGLRQQGNRGFIGRGNLQAPYAFIGEAPRDAEVERGVAMAGAHGKELDRWLQLLELDARVDVFMTTIVQCQPPKELRKSDNKHWQRVPADDEVATCFGPRCLRVLRAMPNLKAVVTLGWPAATAFFGKAEDPKLKSHDAQWFEDSLLPGIPIFCMVDPLWVILNPSPEKTTAVERSLTFFKRECLKSGRIYELAQKARADREARGEGLL